MKRTVRRHLIPTPRQGGLSVGAARLLFTTAATLMALAGAARAKDLPLDLIRLPDGFEISLYAADIPGARSMVRSERGTLFVGTRHDDKVYAVRDADGDFRADEIIVVADDLTMPNGVALRDGDLYVSEIGRILRYDDIEANLRRPPEPVVVTDRFPRDRAHGWKYIAFGPDGKLYVPVGAPCNVCHPDDPIYSSITRLNPDGSGFEIFAHGIRNSVGFDWHPETKEMWFTDNGRDRMGDDLPPDELNRAPRAGMHFGFPFCHGGVISDPRHGDKRSCDAFTPPVLNLGPHVAALGVKFYTGSNFPERYREKVLIAQHGSWDRSQKIGYRVMMATIDNGAARDYEPFAEGWLRGDEAWGRPVDLLVLPDGSLLVSDDHAGVIYRIRYAGG